MLSWRAAIRSKAAWSPTSRKWQSAVSFIAAIRVWLVMKRNAQSWRFIAVGEASAAATRASISSCLSGVAAKLRMLRRFKMACMVVFMVSS